MDSLKLDEAILVIEKAGSKLKLPITTIARSMILYHHFKRCVAEVKYEDSIIAAIAVALSCQVEHKIINNQQIVLVFLDMEGNENPIPKINSEKFKTYINHLAQGKEFYCRMLKFNLKHELAYQYLVPFMKALRKKEIFDRSWDKFAKIVFKVVSTAYMSKRCLEYEASEIAVIAIHIACNFCGIETTQLEEWQKALSIPFQEERMKRGICDIILVCSVTVQKELV